MEMLGRVDRIFLSNFVRSVEVGVFEEEHGVQQRLRFDLTVDVTPRARGAADEVETVMSYDLLVQAVEDLASGPRMNLLEVFAERLAERCLSYPAARKVEIRIAKLDRLEDAELGVEIVRFADDVG